MNIWITRLFRRLLHTATHQIYTANQFEKYNEIDANKQKEKNNCKFEDSSWEKKLGKSDTHGIHKKQKRSRGTQQITYLTNLCKLMEEPQRQRVDVKGVSIAESNRSFEEL